MRNPIINMFLDRGHITKEAADRLENFDAMIKEAGMLDAIWEKAKVMGGLAGPALAGVGATYLGSSIIKKMMSGYKNRTLGMDISMSKRTLMERSPHFEKDPEAASALFNEIAHVAPAIAANASLTDKIIKKYLPTGLDYNAVSGLIKLQKDITDSSQGPIRRPELSPAMAQASDKIFGAPIRSAARGIIHGPEIARQMDAFEATGQAPTQPGHYIKDDASILNSQPGPDEVTITFGGIDKGASVSFTKVAESLADSYPFLKEGAPADWGWENALKILGAAAGVSLGVAGLDKLYKSHKRTELQGNLQDAWKSTLSRLKSQSTKGSYFTSGIDYNDPQVQQQASEAFTTLSNLSPTLALDPLAASTFVNKAILNESQMEPELLKTVSEIQKNIVHAEPEDHPFANSLFGRNFQSTLAGGANFGSKFAPKGRSND